jgi:hypothetical protein
LILYYLYYFTKRKKGKGEPRNKICLYYNRKMEFVKTKTKTESKKEQELLKKVAKLDDTKNNVFK